jgi:exodeoxyribonuclease VII large subunit
MKTPLEIKQLGEEIKNSLPDSSFKVIGEVSQPKNFRGNIYLNLKDNFCSIKSIIWKSKYETFKTEIKDGDKIIVKGKLDFYGANGSVSFIIEKLEKHNGEGELYQLYQQYKKEFEIRGYFKKENKIQLPKKIESILLITSEQGAAIQDFIYALENNNSKLDYKIIDVPVQGSSCPKVIIDKLNSLDQKYDSIVITRGGGSFEDLFGFSQPELVEAIHNFDQPVISAIGHQVDTSLLDLVADCCCPTPSLAAQYIIDINKKFISELDLVRDELKDILIDQFNLQNRELNKCNERLTKIIISFDKIQQNFHADLLKQLTSYSMKLKILDLKLSNLINDDKPIIKNINDESIKFEQFNEIIQEKEDFIIEWNGKKITITNYSIKE